MILRLLEFTHTSEIHLMHYLKAFWFEEERKETWKDLEEANPINLTQVSFLAQFLKNKRGGGDGGGGLQPVSDFYMIIPLTDEGVSKWFAQLISKFTIFFTSLHFCPINASLENPVTPSYILKKKTTCVSFQALVIIVTELLLHSSFLNWWHNMFQRASVSVLCFWCFFVCHFFPLLSPVFSVWMNCLSAT